MKKLSDEARVRRAKLEGHDTRMPKPGTFAGKAMLRVLDLREGFPKQIAKTGPVGGDGTDRTLRQREASRTRVDQRAVAKSRKRS